MCNVSDNLLQLSRSEAQFMAAENRLSNVTQAGKYYV